MTWRFCMLGAGLLFAAAAGSAYADDDAAPERLFPLDPIRARLEQSGVSYGLNWYGEVFDVASGGFSRGGSFSGLVEAYTDIDLEKLAGWKGGAIHANAYYIHGLGPTEKHLGSLAPVSSVEALESLRLFELWFEQKLFDDKLKVKFGQIAADEEFIISGTAEQFLNGTFGWPGSAAVNQLQGGPAFPFAVPGVRVQFSPTEQVTLLAGVFDSLVAPANVEDPQRANPNGTNFRVGDPPLLIGEAQYKYGQALQGTLKLGGWRAYNEYSDVRTGEVLQGNYGLYAIVDQQIWKSGDDKSVTAFVRVSGTPERRNTIDLYVDTGVVFAGLVEGRAKDSFGAAFSYARVPSNARAADQDAGLPVIRDFEALVELNYTAVIHPGWTLTPDFQYFWNPGGRVEDAARPGRPVADAAVIGARTVLNY